MININNKTKLLYAIITAIIGVYIGFEYILPLFIPFVLAYFIAWILLPVVRFLNRKIHMPKLIGGVLSLSLLGSAVVWAFYHLCGIFLQQLTILLRNMPIYLSILGGHVDRFCDGCDAFFGIQLGTMRSYFYSSMDGMLSIVKTKIMPVITSQSLNIMIGLIGIAGILLIILVSILLLIKDEEQYGNSFKSSVFYPDIHLVTSKLSEMGIAYLRTQAIMMIFITILCSLGLLLINNKYALIIGIGIGVFDAFPILGSGLILVPWGISALFNHNLYSAAVLLTLYLGCQIIRQFLEPKLLGNRIGIKPIYTLMSMYIGVKIFGIPGFLLGPLGLVIITTIVKEYKHHLNLAVK
ncbi:MAG: AI-2E family transporter [Anaerocolumna sp.]